MWLSNDISIEWWHDATFFSALTMHLTYLFFKENNVVPKLISNGLNTMLWNKVIKCNSTIFYRSKRESRLLDCYYMKLIVYNIINLTI